ncbi:hypothetical protein G1K73_07520 [Tenacibaculum finnmarkense]|uniref:hypothetical protein n=1 Tax=Tenacibaculum finnmarkense TaxID=2781243 RepID=UPI001EFC22A6|nr:hypothetical protein [Tenacibaculum finnmarkense]MCG8893602.1 hypothetical protein [Tenacibaculum finnmarkense]
MKLKIIVIIHLFLACISINAQEKASHQGLYADIGYEVGFIAATLHKTTMPFTHSNFGSLGSQINNSLSLTALYKTPFNAQIKLGYIGSYANLTIDGLSNEREFTVHTNYFMHTALLGAGYSFQIKKDLDITLGLGSSISFVKNTNLQEEKGDASDKITASNSSVKSGNVYVIPEISVTKYFKNENTITFGAKYYLSDNDSFLTGSVKNSKKSVTTNQVDFSTKNNQIALYVSYGFNFKNIKKIF